MSKIELLIDNREHKIKEYFASFDGVSIIQLDIGDVQFKYNNEIILLIERKTIADLSSSIKDGRHREQKARLLNTGLDISKILYLIEGDIDKSVFKCLPKSTLISSIINTIMRDNIKVYRTLDISDTLFFIESIYNKLKKDGHKLIMDKNADNYVNTLKVRKKDNLTPKNCFILQLAQIPGSSINIANRILEDYASMYSLCNAYSKLECDKSKELLLADLTYDISNNKKRRIGPTVSKRIFQFLNNIT
jgi:crossover junction endonuclease MUS81